jgi:hypothetical protein
MRTSIVYGLEQILFRLIKPSRMKWAGHIAYKGEMRIRYKVLVGKPEGKRPLRRCRHRCEDNINMGFKEIGWKVVDWIYLAQERGQWQALVNMIMHLWVP